MHTKSNYIRPFMMTIGMLLSVMTLSAQSVFELVKDNPNFVASDYGVYPDSDLTALTPAPKGMKPFYVSHYGRHGSRYLNSFKAFEEPYNTLTKADSLGALTPMGKTVMKTIKQLYDDSHGRWGDITEVGKNQVRGIARRMYSNFPEVFRGKAFVDAYSTLVTRCVLSMGAAAQQLVAENPKLQLTLNSSYENMLFMNHQDKMLRDSMLTPHVRKVFAVYAANHRPYYPRLMKVLFNDTTFVRQHVDVQWFCYYLVKTALIQRNVQNYLEAYPLLTLFTPKDLHQFWEQENAWWYVTYGFSPLTNSVEPYSQCELLRKFITDADSIIAGSQHGATLRFGHETVILPLACLLGINGYDYQTNDLEELEVKGWWASKVFPMASNIQLVFYRKNANDKDVLVKVLLNEKEATLPLPSDIAPYYKWSDFREFYLKRIAEGESALSRERNRIHTHLLNHSE